MKEKVAGHKVVCVGVSVFFYSKRPPQFASVSSACACGMEAFQRTT